MGFFNRKETEEQMLKRLSKGAGNVIAMLGQHDGDALTDVVASSGDNGSFSHREFLLYAIK